MKKSLFMLSISAVFLFSACNNSKDQKQQKEQKKDSNYTVVAGTPLNVFTEVELKTNIDHLSASEKQVLSLMFQVSTIMDDIFWQQAYGDKSILLNNTKDSLTNHFIRLNYGPWDRLNNNKPFLTGIGEKPAGANFYPADMTKEEFDALADSNKTNPYTIIRRGDDGKLKVLWYHEAFKAQIDQAAALLNKAAAIAENPGLKKYLTLRAQALLTDSYRESDMAWMDMKTSNLDFVVGPIENYEDHLFGYKSANEAFVLIKDIEWSKKLAYFTQFLPKMQKDLPVDPIYKKETPGSDVDLNVYDVVYYAGDCNAASKTIAINLPNDEQVQLTKGSRKLQLKNAMQAKFDKILIPISNILIAENQRQNVQFNAFFENTMFHEVAHGMGIKNTIDGKSSVREALKETFSTIEEGKADILGLYIVNKLYDMKQLKDINIMDNYVTFMASIFRSIRFGATEAHGAANLIRFNYFLDKQAFTRNEDGTYSVNFDKMKEASTALTQDIIKLQGDGDYKATKDFVTKWTVVSPQLSKDLQRLADANIPKDVYFKQGPAVLGL